MTAWIQLPPETVVGGEFRLGALLGAGGMGAVYVAEQLSTGKRRALKLMHPQLVEDPRQRRRFAQEARVGSLIASDHVVEVVGAGVDEPTGLPWIAMELLQGENLAHAMRRTGPISTEVLCAWFRQLGDALDAAHGAGVVHRDIKPENIFLAKGRGSAVRPTIKVLDFGIAKVAAATQATATALLGSPAWMAPEQTDPRADITPLTDVWPLGLLAFWLLTGQLFWRTASDPNASMHSVLKEILFDAIPRPSRRAGELGCETLLPARFDDWFDRAVHREPRARFASAGELVRELEAVVGAGSRSPSAEPARAERVEAPPETGAVSADGAQATDEFLAGAGLALLTARSAGMPSEPEPAAPGSEPATPEPDPTAPAPATFEPEAAATATAPEAAATAIELAQPQRTGRRTRRWIYGAAAPLVVGLAAAGIWLGTARPASDAAAVAPTATALGSGGEAASVAPTASVLAAATEGTADAGLDGGLGLDAAASEAVASSEPPPARKRKTTSKRTDKVKTQSDVSSSGLASDLDVASSNSKGSAVSGTPTGSSTAAVHKKSAPRPNPPPSSPLPSGNEDKQQIDKVTKP